MIAPFVEETLEAIHIALRAADLTASQVEEILLVGGATRTPLIRRRLAEAFGTHKSFISQVTNPAYRVPLPAQHIPALFKVCHLNAQEQRAFLDVYARAHPGQFGAIEELASLEEGVLRIPLPQFADPERRLQVEQLIRDFAEQVITLLRDAETKA